MEAIIRDPALVSEATMALPTLRQAALAPAGEAGVKRVLGSRMATFPPMEMTEGQWAAWWRDYVDVLGGFAEAQLEHGMRMYLREHGADFLPKPWKLKELAASASTTAAIMHSRAKAAVEEAHRRSQPKREPVDRAQLNLSMAEWRAAMAAKAAARTRDAKPSAPSSPICASTGETGVSDELRRMVRGEEAAA